MHCTYTMPRVAAVLHKRGARTEQRLAVQFRCSADYGATCPLTIYVCRWQGEKETFSAT